MNLPQDFISKMTNLLGSEAQDFFLSLNSPAEKGITVNTKRMDLKKFKENANFEYMPIPLVSNGFFVNSFRFAENVFNHMGVIYSQEPSAMYPVSMMDIQDNDIVLDVCAAPGGKSIQILNALGEKGILVSNEIVFNRAKILDENISRMGYRNSIITCNSPQELSTLDRIFDKIIVDAPCGGEGMIRKTKFNIFDYNPNMIESNSIRQLEILNSVKNLLKNNGLLMYSTCTYDPRENEEVVSKFLKENSEFEIVYKNEFLQASEQGLEIDGKSIGYRRYPHKHKGEGQYMCLLKKCGSKDENIKPKNTTIKGHVSISQKEQVIIKNNLKNIGNFPDFKYLKKGDNIYIVPDTNIDLKNLNTLRVGCLLGTIQKDLLKLSHDFYHTYGEYFKNKIELQESEVNKYLHGEELDKNLTNGIYAVNYLGVTIGGGKIANGKLKNYYKKELRIWEHYY